jgi:hypothetical protein
MFRLAHWGVSTKAFRQSPARIAAARSTKKTARDATIERPAHSRIRVGNLTQGTLTHAGQARRMFGGVRKQAQNAATHSHTQMWWSRPVRLWRFDGGENNWLGDSTNTVRPPST